MSKIKTPVKTLETTGDIVITVSEDGKKPVKMTVNQLMAAVKKKIGR